MNILNHIQSVFCVCLFLVLLTFNIQARALEKTCAIKQAVQQAKSEFLRLRDVQKTNKGQVSIAKFRLAAQQYIELSETCYSEKYGSSANTLNQIDNGGIWFNNNVGVVSEFSTFGTKWGEGSPYAGGQDVPGPGLPGGEVTFSYMANGVDLSAEGSTPNVAIASLPTFSACFITEIENAFDAWSAVANITFKEVPDDGLPFNTGTAANIRIGSHIFDGPNGTLAHGYFPPPNGNTAAGDVHFDQQESWACQDTGPGSLDFGIVALHEFGHAIGMSHQNAPPTVVMNPFYNAVVDSLMPDDILGATSIYGSKTASCRIDTTQTFYSGSDQVTLSAFSVSGASDAEKAVEWKVWFQSPGNLPIGLANEGADSSVVLPAGFFIDLAPVDLFIANEFSSGTYKLGCRLLDPVTGELLNENENSFDIGP